MISIGLTDTIVMSMLGTEELTDWIMRLVFDSAYATLPIVLLVFSSALYFLPIAVSLAGLVVIVANIARACDVNVRFSTNIIIGYWVVGIGVSYTLAHYTAWAWNGIYIGITLGFGYSLLGIAMENRRILTQVFRGK